MQNLMIMANDTYYAKNAIQRAIENNDLREFQRHCNRYMLNTHLEIVMNK